MGGLVRDKPLNRENKDMDIEVHGAHPEVLVSIWDGLGVITEMGASFGVRRLVRVHWGVLESDGSEF